MSHLKIWGTEHIVKMNIILPVELSDDGMNRAQEQTNEWEESAHELSQKISESKKSAEDKRGKSRD